MNEESFRRLQKYMGSVDPAQLDDLLESGRDIKGVTFFDMGKILDFVEENHERARSSVATIACLYAKAGPSTNYLLGLHLGILMLCYQAHYGEQPEFKEFQELVINCAPNLVELQVEISNTFRAQN